MDPLQAAALGVVQGLTEFLPVSSSAHLVLFPRFLGWPYQGLAFDVALHWGTLAALALAFGRDWWNLTAAGLRRDGSASSRLFWGLALATLPAVAAGLLVQDLVEPVFQQPRRMALNLIGFGLLLGLADRAGRGDRGLEALDWRGALAIGLAQALALMPGVSRSGVTITAGLFLGLRRGDAARFSFLMAAPVVLGAGVLKLGDAGPALRTGAFWIGVAAAAASGYAAIRLLLGFVRRRSLLVFVLYRAVLGALLLLAGI